jgi:hypothetical protein
MILTEMKDPVAPLVADVENRLIREGYMRREDAQAERAKAAKTRQRSNN